jgi:predicted LPLAT superfamily acyltransferase
MEYKRKNFLDFVEKAREMCCGESEPRHRLQKLVNLIGEISVKKVASMTDQEIYLWLNFFGLWENPEPVKPIKMNRRTFKHE